MNCARKWPIRNGTLTLWIAHTLREIEREGGGGGENRKPYTVWGCISSITIIVLRAIKECSHSRKNGIYKCTNIRMHIHRNVLERCAQMTTIANTSLRFSGIFMNCVHFCTFVRWAMESAMVFSGHAPDICQYPGFIHSFIHFSFPRYIFQFSQLFQTQLLL